MGMGIRLRRRGGGAVAMEGGAVEMDDGGWRWNGVGLVFRQSESRNGEGTVRQKEMKG